MEIILVVGLPGSGKTHWVNARKTEHDIFLDDVTHFADVIEAVKKDPEHLFIADPNLCYPDTLDYAKELIFAACAFTTKEIFFQNDPEQCRKNAARRNDGRDVENSIRMLSAEYNPPANAIPVWRPDVSDTIL